MTINEKALNKGELRKLTALRKSLGEKIADKAFAEWFAEKPKTKAVGVDPVAVKIAESLAEFVNDKSFKLGTYGYTIRRAKGRGVKPGFVALKNMKPE
jgi:hypothetical protein